MHTAKCEVDRAMKTSFKSTTSPSFHFAIGGQQVHKPAEGGAARHRDRHPPGAARRGRLRVLGAHARAPPRQERQDGVHRPLGGGIRSGM